MPRHQSERAANTGTTGYCPVFDIVEGILKGFALLLRLFVEGGLLDVSLSGTGRFFIKLVYPPHWFKKAEYPKALERWIGVIAWVGFSYAAYYFY